MAILTDGTDQYEVRIKRQSDQTYFEEYVKSDAREDPRSQNCHRYIVGENGTIFTIELTLLQGFCFDSYESVRMKLFFPGQKGEVARIDAHKPKYYEDGFYGTNESITVNLKLANVEIGGCMMLGTKFAFRNLLPDETLKDETDITGVKPESLGHFEVKVFKVKWKTHTMTDAEAAEKAKAKEEKEKRQRDREVSSMKKLREAQKVNKNSFEKDGINYAVGFIGGKPKRESSRSFSERTPITREKGKAVLGNVLYFRFYYRTAAFLQREKILKYPIPLRFWTWEQLKEPERKMVLKELQGMNRTHVQEALLAKNSGGEDGEVVLKSGRDKSKDEPKEWRPWSRMFTWERIQAFKTLKEALKARERGEVQRQFETNAGQIIPLVDQEEPTAASEPGSQVPTDHQPAPEPQPQSQVSAARENNQKRARAVSGLSNNIEDDESTVKKESHGADLDVEAAPAKRSRVEKQGGVEKERSKIKEEPIDLDALPDNIPQAAGALINARDLEKKKAKARRLAEEIKARQEEIKARQELLELQRQQRELEDEIEAGN